MNTRLVNSAAELIRRSMENGKKTPAGWAMDLESAQLLQSPETAAEHARVRLAWRSARGRAADARGEFLGECAQHRTTLELLAKNGDAAAERDCLALAVLFALQWTEGMPVGLREGIDAILTTMPLAGEKSTAPSGDATPEVTIFRAGFEGHDIPLGLYTNAEAARAHCEAYVRREYPAGTQLVMAWSVDEDDPNIVELDVEINGRTESTGYIVTAVPVASEYDPESEE